MAKFLKRLWLSICCTSIFLIHLTRVILSLLCVVSLKWFLNTSNIDGRSINSCVLLYWTTSLICILLLQQSVVVMTLQQLQCIISLSGIFSWLHWGHMSRLLNCFKLTEAIAPFLFLFHYEVELSASVALYSQLSYPVIYVVSVVFNTFSA